MGAIRGSRCNTTIALTNMVMFVVAFQFSGLTSLLPPLVKRVLSSSYGEEYMKDHSGKYIAGLSAAASFFGAISNPFWGRVSDNYGRRPVLLISLLASSVCMAIFSVASIFSVLLAARIGNGLFDASMFISKVITGDVSNSANSSRNYATLYMFFAISETVCPFAVSFFQEIAGWQAFGPCIISSALIFIVFLNVYYFMEEPSAREIVSEQTRGLSIKMILSRRTTAIPVLLYGTLAMVLTGSSVVTSMIIIEPLGGLGLPLSAIGKLFAIQGAAYIASQMFICPALIRAFGAGKMFLCSAWCLVIIFPFAIVPGYLPYPYLIMAVHMVSKNIASSIALTAATVLINDSSSADNRGSVASVAQSTAGILRTLGLLVLGEIYDICLRHERLWIPFALLGFSMAMTATMAHFIAPLEEKALGVQCESS